MVETLGMIEGLGWTSDCNLWAAWIGVLLGMMAGATQGLRFHRSDWLGGYDSWPRRLTRLGHISFFGLGFINFAFVYTLDHLGVSGSEPLPAALAASSVLLIVGAVCMPLVCYLSAWRQGSRHLFFVPVSSLLLGVSTLVTWRVLS